MSVSGTEFTRIGASISAIGIRLTITAKEASTASPYTNINDAIRGATAGSNINDGLRIWYSATSSESLNDAERRWLLAQAATTSGSNSDLWMQFLGGEGYSGSIGDRKLQYWKAQ